MTAERDGFPRQGRHIGRQPASLVPFARQASLARQQVDHEYAQTLLPAKPWPPGTHGDRASGPAAGLHRSNAPGLSLQMSLSLLTPRIHISLSPSLSHDLFHLPLCLSVTPLISPLFISTLSLIFPTKTTLLIGSSFTDCIIIEYTLLHRSVASLPALAAG